MSHTDRFWRLWGSQCELHTYLEPVAGGRAGIQNCGSTGQNFEMIGFKSDRSDRDRMSRIIKYINISIVQSK